MATANTFWYRVCVETAINGRPSTRPALSLPPQILARGIFKISDSSSRLRGRHCLDLLWWWRDAMCTYLLGRARQIFSTPGAVLWLDKWVYESTWCVHEDTWKFSQFSCPANWGFTILHLVSRLFFISLSRSKESYASSLIAFSRCDFKQFSRMSGSKQGSFSYFRCFHAIIICHIPAFAKCDPSIWCL